ncbi:hypothetical protein [Aeromicrobium sp.]|uniref:hypothetical protein n=1 Tax=Aeromicrobium sp. TaxID=1871063 RepID=UPI002FCC5C77
MTTSDAPDPTPRSATLLESVDHTRSSMLDAVRTGAIAYTAVWVVTFLIGAAALLAVEAEDNVPWSWYLTTPGQAIAMSSNGAFSQTTTVDFGDEFDEEYSEEFGGEFDEEFDEEFSDLEEGEDLGFPEDGECCTDEGELIDESFPSDDELSEEEFDDELSVDELSDDEFDEAFGDEFTSTSQFTAISLTVLALMVGVLWVASRRAERRRSTPSRKSVLAAAVVTGTTFALFTWAVAFAARVDLEGSWGHAGSLSILFYASVLGTVVALLARRPIARHQALSHVPTQLAAAVRGVVVYLAAFVVLLVPTAAIYAIVKGEAEAILVFPLAILNLAAYGITFGQFAGVESPVFAFGDDSGARFVWLFSKDVDGFLYVLIPLSLVALAVAVAALTRRSAGRSRTSLDAFWLVATFAGTGALLTALTVVSTSTSSFGAAFGESSETFSISLSLVPWFFLVMAGWGVITEIAIRIVGRPLAAVVPDKLLDRLAGS